MTPEETELLRQEKQCLRREIRNAASALPEDYRTWASGCIAEQVTALETYRKARVVMAFMSLPSEPDTREIIQDAIRKGKTVLLPRCVSPERMTALPFTGWEDLESGWLGIREPKIPEADIRIPEPELILVPCVSASPDGRRLGHGAGYYDRFLAGRKAETVCLCFRRLMRKDIPAGPADRRVDRVITEKAQSAGIWLDGCPYKE